MSVLPYAKALTDWFQAVGNQAPLVLTADWDEAGQDTLAAFSAKDVFILELEKDKRLFSIENVRKMMAACTTTTPFGRRLIVIPQAERLSLPAAQALLKFLEEPTAGNRILMVTKFPKRLLPTIRSRVQVVRMPTPSLPPEAGGLPLVPFQGPREGEQINPLKLLTSKSRRGLSEEELETVTAGLQKRIISGDTGSATFRALLRLRDYYKIRSAGGNEKLASDVLLASLIELENSPTPS